MNQDRDAIRRIYAEMNVTQGYIGRLRGLKDAAISKRSFADRLGSTFPDLRFFTSAAEPLVLAGLMPGMFEYPEGLRAKPRAGSRGTLTDIQPVPGWMALKQESQQPGLRPRSQG